ncbi:acyltransferase family protein [Acinetobacter baumannii]|uniref:acyltransferase family protein n=1 Tax=Acinetobacter baumannii TaxID=470 RepID=UPI003CF0DFE2
MNRYESLDWLRGLMAFSIMIYHVVSWEFFQPQAGSILGNFGVYGVSIFFVLSGLSMGIVYNNFITDLQSSFIFFVRRLFRLLPLLWIAVVIISLVSFFYWNEFELNKFVLNMTLLFGFIAPGEYINTGAWSIGNEIVYYALTPILIFLYSKNKKLGNMVVVISILIGIIFAFNLLNPKQTLAEQWLIYIHPLNNLFFYTCGIALYYNFHKLDMKNIAKVLVVIPLAILCFYPIDGDQINITTGINRVIFSMSSIALVLGFYKLRLNLPSLVTRPFASLGEATYGVYLLHPVVYIFTNHFFENTILCVISTVGITLIAAFLSYNFYEKRFIIIGKKVTTFELKKLEQVG